MFDNVIVKVSGILCPVCYIAFCFYTKSTFSTFQDVMSNIFTSFRPGRTICLYIDIAVNPIIEIKHSLRLCHLIYKCMFFQKLN